VQAALKMEIEAYREIAQTSREEVIAGIKDAIGQAKLIADPGTQIKGWTELAKMLGYYAPEVKRIDISVNADRARMKLETLPDSELLEIIAGSKNLPVLEGEVIDSTEEKDGAEAPAAGSTEAEAAGEAPSLRAEEQEGRQPAP